MAQTTLIKKRKKIPSDILYLDYTMLDKEQVLELYMELKEKIKEIFREHIGEQYSITLDDVFERLFARMSEDVEMYKRAYWFNVIKEIIRQLRGSGQMFIIHKRDNYFVLKEQNEAEYYKAVCDNDIQKLENAKKRADTWVKEKKWQRI